MNGATNNRGSSLNVGSEDLTTGRVSAFDFFRTRTCVSTFLISFFLSLFTLFFVAIEVALAAERTWERRATATATAIATMPLAASMSRKRLPLLAATVALAACLLLFTSPASLRSTWRSLPQHVGLGDHVSAPNNPNPNSPHSNLDLAPSDPDYANWNPKPDFKKGSKLPGDHNYTTALVIARTKKEDIGWMDEQVPAEVRRYVYVADDMGAPLHPPKNKGHEVMVYLTYVIDHYEELADVSVFLHAHQVCC